MSITTPVEQRRDERWRDLLRPGQQVQATWAAPDDQAGDQQQIVSGRVRAVFGDTIWVWLDREQKVEQCPRIEQAVDLLIAGEDALRLVPCRLLDESRGGSLQVTVSGRISRVQRRDDVRARVEMPPVSAVRLGLDDSPRGLLGVRLLDLSAGGVCFQVPERLATVDRLRLVLHLDDGPPLTPTVEVLESGTVSRGRFSEMPERERRRIVQYVYRQELAERQADETANWLD